MQCLMMCWLMYLSVVAPQPYNTESHFKDAYKLGGNSTKVACKHQLA